MKIKDEGEWQSQLAAFAADDNPTTETCKNFTIAWAEAAEADMMFDMGDRGPALFSTPIQALRNTLRQVEGTHGKLLNQVLGACMTLIYFHWEHGGDALFNSMTPIEQCHIEEAVVFKMLKMKMDAAQAGNQEEE